MIYDAIIIGGGLGGLTSGAILSQKGMKVLLIEQHKVVGGCASTFKRKDYIIEASLHELDGLDENDIKIKIFEELDVFNHVNFLKLPELYSVNICNSKFIFSHDKEDARKKLISKFPQEEEGIVAFFTTIKRIKEESDYLFLNGWPPFYENIVSGQESLLIKYNNTTVGDFVDLVVNNEELKLILLANLSYYHDNPYSLSLIYFSTAQESYYRGSWYIQGGSQMLSNYLLKLINNNGKVVLNSTVTDIIVKDDKAVGVKYSNKSNMETVYAKYIISNSSYENTIKMLPKSCQQEFNNTLCNMEVSCSFTSVYLMFKEDVSSKLDWFDNYSTIIIPSSVNSLKEIFNQNYNNKIINFVYYSQIDSKLTSPDKGVGVITVVDYLNNWDINDKKKYKQKKNEVAKILINRVNEIIPIQPFIDSYEVATPHTIKRYTLNPQGAVYGYSQIIKQTGSYRPNNKTSIDELYMSSAWVSPGGGFSGTIISGWKCATEILKKNDLLQ